MKKRIIIYADGTWNTPANMDDNAIAPTNVFRMFEKTPEGIGKDGVEQITYYEEGVGTGPGKDKLEGGLLGKGINEHIMDAYRFICDHYEPNDEIFLFGFSRGAYTVRSIAGLIKNCGILKKQYYQKVQRAFDIYRSKKPKDIPSSEQSKLFRKFFSHPMETTAIKFIGVWDTVGCLGVPFKAFGRNNKFRFHDVQLSDIILNAYHAISIDERRVFFRPTLWRKQDKEHLKKQQALEQVWFCGVHCDVGGGYHKGELYKLPLHYLGQRAKQQGLRLNEGEINIDELREQARSSVMNNSKDSLKYKIFPDYYRAIDTSKIKELSLFQKIGMAWLKLIMKDNNEGVGHLATHEFLHESVVLRYADDPSKMPVNLKATFKELIDKKRVVQF